MELKLGLTFDDVLLVPNASDISSRRDVNLQSFLSKNIPLNLPVVSANMDTVTESDMAIAMAKEGGIGIIHRFMSIADQTEEVLSVKRYESIMVEEPFTLSLDGYTIREAKNLMAKHKVTGILIVDGKKRLQGILTRRDIALEDDDNKKIAEVMTPKNRLVTVSDEVSTETAKEILKKNKIEKLPIIDRSGRVKGLITSKDILKTIENPHALKDKKGRLRVGAAIGVKGDYLERLNSLVKAGIDVIVIDIAHGHAKHAIETVKLVKRKYASLDVIAGNVATKEGAYDLIKAGADAVKVGVGPGSMCTTRVVSGHGVPQITAISDCVSVARKYKIPVIADGGIRYSGDMVKALAAGASSVMIGFLLAGTEESPGMTIIRNGQKFKIGRGMASLGANFSRRKAEGQDDFGLKEYVAEGVEALVPYRGHVREIINQLVGGLRSGMSYSGAGSIKELWEKSRFIQITSAGLKENFPHDVEVV